MDSTTTRLSAAFQGEIGAFSYVATQKLLGMDVDAKPFESFKGVFESLMDGAVAYAVIPIENTLYGSVHENYDHLLHYRLSICGETTLRIAHNLITRPELELHQIRRAFSHPVALDQCRQFFLDHPAIQPVPYYDTAGSVKMLMAESLTDVAAIASESAAALYGGKILARGVEDNQGNFTRFFLLTKQPELRSKKELASQAWKTSVVFATPNAPGALFKALACFALRNLDLTKLESRPSRDKPWEYLFYLDIAGAVQDTAVIKAIENLEEITSFFRILGSYHPTL